MNVHAFNRRSIFRGMVINSSYGRKENSVFRADSMHLKDHLHLIRGEVLEKLLTWSLNKMLHKIIIRFEFLFV